LHEATLNQGFGFSAERIKQLTCASGGAAEAVLRALRGAGVQLFGGPRAMQHGLVDNAACSMGVEYGDLRFVLGFAPATSIPS
jgi:hypothetical protein